MLHVCIERWPVVDVCPPAITVKDDQICGAERNWITAPHLIRRFMGWMKSWDNLCRQWNEVICPPRLLYTMRRAAQQSKDYLRLLLSLCLKGVSRGFLCRKAALQMPPSTVCKPARLCWEGSRVHWDDFVFQMTRESLRRRSGGTGDGRRVKAAIILLQNNTDSLMNWFFCPHSDVRISSHLVNTDVNRVATLSVNTY